MTPAVALAPLAALAAGSALADFGAIAYSASTGGVGAAWGVGDRATAQADALERCAAFGGDCSVAVAFEGACGALARGDDPARRAGAAAPALAEAEARALAACRRLDPASCRIETSFCSDR